MTPRGSDKPLPRASEPTLPTTPARTRTARTRTTWTDDFSRPTPHPGTHGGVRLPVDSCLVRVRDVECRTPPGMARGACRRVRRPRTFGPRSRAAPGRPRFPEPPRSSRFLSCHPTSSPATMAISDRTHSRPGVAHGFRCRRTWCADRTHGRHSFFDDRGTSDDRTSGPDFRAHPLPFPPTHSPP